MTDSGQIPALTLPSGGTVEFIDLDDLTAYQVHQVRKTIDSKDSAGQTTNLLFIEAMRIGVKNWDVPYLNDPRPPAENPSAWKYLKARDSRAIEGALQPVLDLLKPVEAADPGDDTPGSPTPPGSE